MSLQRQILEVIASFKDEVTAPLRSMSDGIKGVGKDIEENFTHSIKQMGTALLEFAAVEKLVEFFKDAWEAGVKLRESQDELALALRNTGASVGEYGEKAESTVIKLEHLTKYTDEQLRSALGRLITNTGDASGSIDHLGLVADIAAARHIDLQSAADLVAKAMEGNTAALKRSGIAINTMLPIMPQLEERFKGQAEAAKEAGGNLDELGKAWDHFKEHVGGGLLTGLQSLIGFIKTGSAVGAAEYVATEKAITESAKGESDKRTIITKAEFDARLREAQADGTKLVSEDSKLNDALSAARTKLNNVLKNAVKTEVDGRVSYTNEGMAAIERAEAEVGTARAAIAKKSAEERQKADEAAAKAQEAALRTLQKIQQDFLKDFAGEVPTAVAALTKKVAELTAQAEEWANSTDPKIRAQADAVRQLAIQYQNIVPVLTELGTLAEDVAKTEKDPDRITALNRLNDELFQANLLRQAAGENTQALAEADKLILRIQGDITAETQKTKDAAEKVAQAMHDQLPTEKELHDEVTKIREEQQKHRDAVAETAHEAVDLVAQFGGVSDHMGKMLHDGIDLANLISKLAADTQNFSKGLSLANVGTLIGAVGAFGSLLSGLFEDNPRTAAMKALMIKNESTMRDLVDINGQLVNISAPGRVAAAVQGLNGGEVFQGAFDKDATFAGHAGPRYSAAKLSGLLASKGITLSEFRGFAGDLGIDLDEKNGTFSGIAIDQFLNASREYKPTAYGNDFGGDVGQKKFENQLAGTSGLTLDQYRELVSGAHGSPALAALFAGLDLSKPADEATMLQRVKSLGAHVNDLAPSDFGGLTVSQFTDTLSGIADDLNTALAAPAADTGSSAPDTGSGPTVPDAGTDVGSSPTVDTGTYVPPTDSGYTPNSTTGMSLDLGPVVDAIAETNSWLAMIADFARATTGNTADMASLMNGGGLVATIDNGLAIQRDITAANNGRPGC